MELVDLGIISDPDITGLNNLRRNEQEKYREKRKKAFDGRRSMNKHASYLNRSPRSRTPDRDRLNLVNQTSSPSKPSVTIFSQRKKNTVKKPRAHSYQRHIQVKSQLEPKPPNGLSKAKISVPIQPIPAGRGKAEDHSSSGRHVSTDQQE